MTTLVWEAIPALTYRLQYKTNFGDMNWTDRAPDILTTNKFVRLTDPGAADSGRFYRVVWMQ